MSFFVARGRNALGVATLIAVMGVIIYLVGPLSASRASRLQPVGTVARTSSSTFASPPVGSTYTWVGGTPAVTTDWTVATNWNPTRVTPAATDKLVIDGTATPAPTITNIPNQTIATLSLTNNAAATFNATASSQTLTISGATGTDFSIPNGSSLTLGSSNALAISLSSGSKATVGGQITLQDGAHRLLAADVSGVTFQSGSIFTTAAGFSGNPFGTGTDGSIVFQMGSSSFFNAGSDAFGGSGHGIANFNLGSSQTFNASSAFASDGRTYGSLTLDGNQTYAGSGSGLLTIFNSLNIVSGSTLTLSGAAGGDLNLLGDIAVDGTLTTNGRTVKFQGGSLTQNVTTSATFGDVSISKTGGTVKLGGALTINGALQFDGTGSAVDVVEFNQKTLNLNGTVGGVSASSANGFKGDASGASLNIGGAGALGTLKFVSGSQTLKSLVFNRGTSGTVSMASPLAAGSLTLTNGILTTTSTNLLTVTGPASNALVGGSATSYINGPLARALPANLLTGTTYSFPIGKGTFNGFDLVNPTTVGTATVQAEVFDANSGGTAVNGLSSLNTNRYWSSSVTAGSFTNTKIRLTDASVAATSRIGQSGSVNGSYNSIGGSASGSTITSNSITSLGFFAIGAISCPGGFTVNDNGDSPDANPGDATCADTNGKCTLRAAIQEANADTGCAEVAINFGVPTPSVISISGTELAISHNVNLNGTGANSLTVQRSPALSARVFNIQNVTVNISDLTILNGADTNGGCIINSGTLKLSNAVVSGCNAGIAGGGIYNNSGTLTVANSTVNSNSSSFNGGGIFNFEGTLTILNSTVGNNIARGIGGNSGGVGNQAISHSSTLAIVSSTISGNDADNGAAIGNIGPAAAQITNSTLSGNRASKSGGGLFNEGFVTFGDTTVTNNRSDSDATGNEPGGGIFRSSGIITLKNSIVAGNFQGTGNTLDDVSGALDSTSSFNLIGDGTNMSGIGNGANGNLVGSSSSPINALLGSLANNGGPTMTHVLLPGSPAINAGSVGNLPTDAFDLDNDTNTSETLPVDQRGAGFNRVIGTSVDIGSLEYTPAATITSVSSSVNPSDLGEAVTFVATVSSGAAPFTGTVQFKDGANNLGNPVACVAGSGNACTAQLTSAALTAGTHSITASYHDASQNFGASSGTLNGGQFVRTQPSLTIDDVSASEGDNGAKSFLFTVSLSAASHLQVTCSFATADGSAAAGTDYQANAGTLTFNAGETVKQISISVNGDQLFEPNETFAVNLLNPVNAAITRSSGTGTIINDDAQGGIISFAQAEYTVFEAAGALAITVNRSGDTRFPAAVDYATDDSGSPAPCASFNGFASSRCDFTSTMGTLRFGANENQKTITVLVNRDSYGVEIPYDAFLVKLTNLTGGAVFGNLSTATVKIMESGVPAPNAIDDSSIFVRQHYHDFLNREPDASGFQFWINEIESCGTTAACREVKRINVSGAFFLSIEFQQTGYLVERLYKAAYGDANGTSNFGSNHQIAVPIVRLNEFLADTQAIGSGIIVGEGNWQQQLEDNKVAFTAAFVQRQRFVNALGATSNAQFVDALNANAASPLSLSERNQCVSDLNNNAKTRAEVLRLVAEHPNLINSEFNRAFVLMQYFGYLRRNPNDAPESTLDYTGYDFWLTKLNQFGGNFQNAEMVKAFISSSEYRHRFGP